MDIFFYCYKIINMKNKYFYVYILKCGDESYYIGYTENLLERLKSHYRAEASMYTRKRQPVKLVFFLEFLKRYDALNVEKQIKNWSKKKKEALISGDLEMLQALSKNTHHKLFCLKNL